MAAKSVTHAKAGVLLAAYLKILSFFFFVIPGMISRILFPGKSSIQILCDLVFGGVFVLRK